MTHPVQAEVMGIKKHTLLGVLFYSLEFLL